MRFAKNVHDIPSSKYLGSGEKSDFGVHVPFANI